MKKITVLFLLILFSKSVFAIANTKVVVEVPGMVCQMCVDGMKKVFKDSVKDPDTDIVVNLDNKTVKLNLAKNLSDEQIQSKVTDAGYNAKNIIRDGKK